MPEVNTAARHVEPELLDHLSPSDPLAVASRRDLRRVHRAMRSLAILKRAISCVRSSLAPRTILELGAGDGSLMLRLARTMRTHWNGRVHLTLLDRHNLLSPAAYDAFERLDWRVTVLCTDALEWARLPSAHRYDLCVTTLFLHHFDNTELTGLLTGVAAKVDAFVACEPHRSRLAAIGSQLVALLGASQVTRADSVKSVAAGFRARELTDHWSGVAGEWRLAEYDAWPFTHCFRAERVSCAVRTYAR